MILGGDVKHPLGCSQVGRVFNGLSQCMTKLCRARSSTRLESNGDGIGHNQTGIPHMPAKGIDRTFAVFVLIKRLVLKCRGLDRMLILELIRSEERRVGNEGSSRA